MDGAVFTYGTLIFPDIMAAVAGRAPPAEPAALHGYRRHSLRGRPYPAIVPASDACVNGVLYRGVDRRLLRRIDRFEGGEYRRRRVLVRGDGGAAVRAWAYVLAPGHAHLLRPAPWDPERFRRRGAPAFRDACHRFRRG